MNVYRTYLTTSAMALLTFAATSTGRADIISGLEVHYEFENTANLGENSAGVSGMGWG